MINNKSTRWAVTALLLVGGALGACQDMTTGQQGAAAGAAAGTGISLVTGGGFGQTVGAGLIGGAAGYVVGSAVGE